MKQSFAPKSISRRRFLHASGLTLASTALSSLHIGCANDRIRIGMVGMGRRSAQLMSQFLKIPNVELVAISDPDTAQMQARLQTAEKIIADEEAKPEMQGKKLLTSKIDAIQDYRRLYDRNDIDAVVISSPNYWHTLHAIQAAQAGKHAYVEKPITFSPWEGKQLQAAVERYGKIIVPGYQNRSDPAPQMGIQYAQEGNLGKILKVRSLCYRNRQSIGGPTSKPFTPPANLDYNLWLGPAQEHKIKRPNLHYDWHWDFNTGNGDLGNQGVHETDLVYWLLGHPGLPTEINCFGNRFAWNDSGNTPNMLTAWCQWGGVDVIMETNDMRLAPNRNASPQRLGTRVGIIAECENGYVKGGRNGMMAVKSDGKTIIERFKGDGGKVHQQSFIDAIRANDPSNFPTTVAQSTPSEDLMHYSNAAYRLGTLQSETDLKNTLAGKEDLLEIISDQNKQLKDWGIGEPQYISGKTIQIHPESGQVKTPGVGPEMVGPHYRKGFEVPKLT